MPFAVTHVLVTIILIDLFRDYFIGKKGFIPLHFIFLGGVASLLPDIDIPIYWVINNLIGIKTSWFHGTISHTFLIPAIFLVAAVIVHRINKKNAVLLYVVTFAYAFHIVLDFLLNGKIMPFWPFSGFTWQGLMANFPLKHWDLGLDAFILLGWLWHEERKHRISDFI